MTGSATSPTTAASSSIGPTTTRTNASSRTSTSSAPLDEGLELTLYEPIRAEFPDTILVSVSHRSTVEQFHGRQLELVGGGEWRLDPLTTSS